LVAYGWATASFAQSDARAALTGATSGEIAFNTPASLVFDAKDPRLTLAGPVTLAGELAFPSGSGPFPLMVIAHGCNGVGNAETGWASVLQEWGYATFIMDSFTGRGLDEVCTNAAALIGLQRIPDAYGALRRLAKHPRLDVRRAALMGFSHGGILTLGASTAWARQTFAQPGDPAFRAFFPFYPYCNPDYPERHKISAPLRIHTGQLDDWTPAAPCSRLVESLKASGQDAGIEVYPGAHHSFDDVELPVMRLPNADNGATCSFKFASILGPYASPEERARCLRKGATIGGNRAATEKAEQILRAQLAKLLK
jgi:dienelactone hydrolase